MTRLQRASIKKRFMLCGFSIANIKMFSSIKSWDAEIKKRLHKMRLFSRFSIAGQAEKTARAEAV